MADLDDIYSNRVFELAAAISHTARLAAPDATASANSKLCGSSITVDVTMDGGRVSGYGQTVKACLLGQAAAAIVAEAIEGATVDEVRTAAREMRAMLKADGPSPGGRFADLALLRSVKDYPGRHASTLIVFDALERALDEVAARRRGAGPGKV